MRSIATLTLLAALAVPSPLALAQDDPAAPATAPDEAAAEPAAPVETKHSVTIAGRVLDYTATTGTITLAEEDGTEKANVFFVAYTLDGVDEPRRRPVTFTFNGGPGSSSVWLHMGAFGPKRVLMDDDGNPVGPPYELVENEGSILDVTDLVFIDPVTTGYSRAVPGEDDRQFHGVDEDVESVGEFIRLWTARYERWSSPKYLAGESYGTTRAGGLAGHLQDRHGMFLNGIVLVSSILNFGTARFDRGNDLPYVLFLPTLTATAWYHDRLPADLQRDLRATLDKVEAFAAGEYATALMQGDALPDAERARIATRLSQYTGLTEAFIDRCNLRVSQTRFTKELLRGKRRTVGRLDSRFTGIDADAAGERREYDPSYSAIQGPYTAMLNDYVRRELGYESDLTYEILTGRVWPWSYSDYENRYLNVAETLRRAMTKNQRLRVFVASGYYDLATPYFATDYTFSHLGLEPELRDHVTIEYYESGHMMYIHTPSRAKLRRDLVEFYRAASGPS